MLDKLFVQTFTYSGEAVVSARRERVLDRLSDPFLFTGSIGHVTIVEGFLPEANKYVMLSSLKTAVNKFKAIYAMGYDKERLCTVPGVVEGPLISPNGLMYKGSTDDGRLTWEAHLTVVGYSDSTTKLAITVVTSHEVDLLHRVFGASCFNLAEHWVKDHLIPYFTLYFREPESSALEVSPTLVFSENGPVKDVVPKALRSMKNVLQGFITVRGEGVVGIITVRNGEPYTAELEHGGKSFSDAEALAEMEDLDIVAKVLGYEVDTWPAVIALARNTMR